MTEIVEQQPIAKPANITLTVLKKPDGENGYTLIGININTEDGNVVPADMQDIAFAPLYDNNKEPYATKTLIDCEDSDYGIVFTGKAPVWLYAHLVSTINGAPWVGTFDPRLGIVVVATNGADLDIGCIVTVPAT